MCSFFLHNGSLTVELDLAAFESYEMGHILVHVFKRL